MSEPKKIQLPVEAATPAFCENQDDFYKMVFAMARVWADECGEEMSFVTFGIKLLLHEYFALVCSGRMKPYLIEEDIKEQEIEGFKEMINFQNQWLTNIGVPMKEGEHGKVEFDYDALDEMIKRREDGKAKSR